VKNAQSNRAGSSALSDLELSEGKSNGHSSYFDYILRTLDNRLYIGITNDLNQRFQTHRSKKGSLFTKIHPVATLVYSEKYPNLASARKREIQLKRWSRAKKEALILGNLALLKKL